MHLLISRQDGRAHWDCEPLTAEDHACGILSSKPSPGGEGFEERCVF